jgi:hypothetical protein
MDPNASLQQYSQWYLIDSMYRSYPSPAPSDPSPAPRPPPQLDPYPMPADFSQIPSSIGPTRIARRQSTDQKPAIHRRNSPPYQVRNASFLFFFFVTSTLHRCPTPAQIPHIARIPGLPSFNHPYTTPLLHTTTPIGLANGRTTTVVPHLYPVLHPSNPLPVLQSQASRVEIRL